MGAKVIEKNADGFTITVTIPHATSMLAFEENIQKAVNDVGRVSTQEALTHFDTDGSPLVIGNQKLLSS